MPTIYTVGHSTRELDDFLRLLEQHQIKLLCDIRAFPMSRRLPHFNREALEAALVAHGVDYRWAPALGGRRKRTLSKDESPNSALRNDSFRNYADYMLTEDFRAGVRGLIEAGQQRRVAIMCAESVYFRCHRMLVSDWLVAHGCEVLHIESERAPRAHQLTREARLVGDDVHYSGDRLF